MLDRQRRVQTFVVLINGNELPVEVAAALDEVVVEDDLAQPAMFTLRFNDPHVKLIEDDLFRLGNDVQLGGARVNEPRAQTILIGEITALELVLEQQAKQLIVRGYDHAHRLQRGVKTRTFFQQSDSEIAGQIARENGLSIDSTVTATQHSYVIQANQTDLQFLRTRAARHGYQVSVKNQQLCFRRADAAAPTAPVQEWGTTLLAFRAALSAAAQPTTVQVRGWDAKEKRPIVGKATRAAQPWRIGDGQRGGQAAAQAFGSEATIVISDQLVYSQAEADQVAQALLDELGEAYLTAEGSCLGEPSLRAGTLVELKGIGGKLGGSYFVSATRHTYTVQEGYLTTFYVNGRRPGGLLAVIAEQPPCQRISGVVVGIVTNNNDPQKRGRIKVKFPWLDDSHESDWARLVMPWAGDQHPPEKDDMPKIDAEVLVAFEQGDLGRCYVIGRLD